MPKNHTVTLGECIASLTEKSGFFDYQRIHDDGANAALKGNRPNPNVLAVGDVVVLPDAKPKTVALAPTKTHTFVVKRVPTLLRIRVVDGTDAGIADLKYELKVGALKYDGTTPADGKIEHPIPATAKKGTLQLWKK